MDIKHGLQWLLGRVKLCGGPYKAIITAPWPPTDMWKPISQKLVPQKCQRGCLSLSVSIRKIKNNYNSSTEIFTLLLTRNFVHCWWWILIGYFVHVRYSMQIAMPLLLSSIKQTYKTALLFKIMLFGSWHQNDMSSAKQHKFK